jgi:hypothetical protein
VPRVAPLVTGVVVLLTMTPARASEHDWYALHSSHFIVYANGGERNARAVAWRFEQARSAIAAMCPWARVGSAEADCGAGRAGRGLSGSIPDRVRPCAGRFINTKLELRQVARTERPNAHVRRSGCGGSRKPSKDARDSRGCQTRRRSGLCPRRIARLPRLWMDCGTTPHRTISSRRPSPETWPTAGSR